MNQEPLFDAPIPGMSLTHELGARPWQSPAQFPTVDEAIEYYMSRMATDEFADKLVELMETGLPLTTIANSIQLANVMEGRHSIDVGMLVMPLLIEMMMLIGDAAEVKYEPGMADEPSDITNDAMLTNVRRKLKEQMSKKDDEVEKNNEDDEVEEEPRGLMARRAS